MATAASLVLGLAYVILWAGKPAGPFVTWLAPSDLWGTYLASVALVHGHLSAAYGAYPGILLIFAPAAAIGSALHLEVGPQFSAVAAPNGWLLIGPVELLVASVPLFSCDAIAERFGVPRARRYALALFEAVVLANLTIKWGHPEDALAVGLVLYAALEADRGRWRRGGWLLGVALVVQPLALLAVPALATAAAVAGWRRLADLAVRTILPGVVALGPALLADWHQLSYWLTRQPNYPDFNHYTPWTSLSPSLTYQGYRAVAGGPGRLYALVSVAVLSVLIVRGRPRLDRIVLALGVAYLARVAFESVLDSYYVWPVLTVAILLASRKGWPRLVATFAIAVVATWFSNADWQGIWPWWSIMMVLLVVVLAAAWPGRDRAQPAVHPGTEAALAPAASVDERRLAPEPMGADR